MTHHRTPVQALAPGLHSIAESREEASQKPGRSVVGHEAGKDHYGPPSARRLKAQQRQLGHEKRGFRARAPLQQLIQPPGRRNELAVGYFLPCMGSPSPANSGAGSWPRNILPRSWYNG